jgi:type IV secretory pathway TraG/TraD family ATPase VirD4
MLLNEVLDAAKHQAARSMTGRLDPPLRIAGDEIANVAPIPKLPGNLSDSRGVGIQWFAAFQSVAQIIARWGEDDGRQILANLNCSVIMGGLQDEKALDRFSALVGDTDVTEVTATLDAANTATGRNITTTERTALRAEEIRLIPDGQALVIYRNAPAMLVTLIPWTHRPDGPDIAAGITRVRTARTTHRT